MMNVSNSEFLKLAKGKAGDENLMNFLQDVPDPRSTKNRVYPIFHILVIILLGFSSGCTSVKTTCDEMKYKKRTLKSCFGIRKIPSHDTCSRVLRMLNPAFLNFVLWTWAGLLTEETISHICFDGKAVKAAAKNKGKEGAEYPTYIMNAFNADFAIFLGQKKVGEKSAEISILPSVIDLTYIEGNTVTADAMGTHSNIIQMILERGGYFMLPAKENQKNLIEDIKAILEDARADREKDENRGIKKESFSDLDHGRYDIRSIEMAEVKDSSWFTDSDWKSVKSVIKVKRLSTDRKTGKQSLQEVYYITNRSCTCEEACTLIRDHWKCEVSHHILDGEKFMEDRSNCRNYNAIENMAALRKIAFNLQRILEIRKGQANADFQPQRFLDHNTMAFKQLLEEPVPRFVA